MSNAPDTTVDDDQEVASADATAGPRNVIEAIAAVMRDLPGIGKDAKSPQGYNYRGIEAITQEAQRLLGKYRLVYIPRVLERSIVDIIVNDKPWTDTILTVEYDIYGPGGVDDVISCGPLVGIGRDNSDKGANKAMTQAYKYALIQTLCIGDHKDDPDSQEAHEADTPGRRSAVPDPAHEARREAARRIKALPDEQRATIAERCDDDGMGRVSAKWTDDQLARVHGWLDELEAVAEETTGASESTPVVTDEDDALEGTPTPPDGASGDEGARSGGSDPYADVDTELVDAILAEIDDDTPEETIRETLYEMKNNELQYALHVRNQRSSGVKAELVERLVAVLSHVPRSDQEGEG